MRLNLPAAAGLLPLAFLGACTTPHAGSEPVQGLVYDCRAPDGASVGEALILFNGQGYQPAGRVLSPGTEPAPRSKATLRFRNREHELEASWAYLGMRYRSLAPTEPGRRLVWAADGEDARILSVAEEQDGEETELASCARRRQVAIPHARDEHGGTEDPHHR